MLRLVVIEHGERIKRSAACASWRRIWLAKDVPLCIWIELSPPMAIKEVLLAILADESQQHTDSTIAFDDLAQDAKLLLAVAE